MTDEVGAITGPVEAWVEADRIKVRYEGALDEYTVTGSLGEQTPEEAFEILATDPGPDEYGNARTVDLA